MAVYSGQGDKQSGNSEWNRLDFAVRRVLNQTATATLVLVKAVNGRRVDVQPMVAQLDGAGNAVPHGTIHDLPVMRLQGGGSAVVLTPAVGDIGLAVFAHSDISAAKNNEAPSAPGSVRKFDWADGLYIGGFLGGEPTQYVRLDVDGVTVQAADGSPVTINAPGGAVITAPTTTIDGNLMVTGAVSSGAGSTFGGVPFDTHKHTGVTTGGGVSGPPAPATP